MSRLAMAAEETNYRHALNNFRHSCDLRQGHTVKVKGDRGVGGRWAPLSLNNWAEDAAWCSGHRFSEVGKEEKVREKVLPVDDYLIGKCSPLDLSLPMVETVGAFNRDGRFKYHRELPAVTSRSASKGLDNSSRHPKFELSPESYRCAHAPDVAVSPAGCLQALEDAIASMESTSKMPGCYVGSASWLETEQQKRARDKLHSLVSQHKSAHLSRQQRLKYAADAETGVSIMSRLSHTVPSGAYV